MSNAEKLRSTTVAMIEAFADAPDDEWAQTLVLDAIDEELRAVRREYEDVVKAAAVLLEEADEAAFKGVTRERLRKALAKVNSTGTA